MTASHEFVYLRFRGRTRRLPLLAIATVLHRSVEAAAEALEILILGPPENRPVPNLPTPPSPAPTHRGEGGKGGGAQAQTQMKISCWEQEQGSGDGGTGEGAEATTIAHQLLAKLGTDANRVAIERLATEHPAPRLYEAMRRTLRVPPERIRASRSAIFTGIVRKLASEASLEPNP